MNADFKDTNPLAISWHDTTRIPQLNPANVLDYFCDRCNPFYLKTCNNEVLRMQNRDMEQLVHMTGIEYIVLHVQDPILFVIRKQLRNSPTQVTPLADYYILAGTVYQAPDLQSVLNSRLMTGVHHLISAFDETLSYMRYHPTKGYNWDFGKDPSTSSFDKNKEKDKEKDATGVRSDMGSSFQRRRVDLLLAELARKFPPKSMTAGETKAESAVNSLPEGSKTAADTTISKGDRTNDVNAAAAAKRTASSETSTQPTSKLLRTN